MKKLLVIVMLIATGALVTSAKGRNGVYLTAKDYKDQKLSYTADSKIHLNNSVLELPYITVVDNNKKIKLDKSAVFAYVDGNEKVYRFYKNNQYLIVAAGPIAIYTQAEHVAQSKGYKVKMKYYFSTTVEGTIMPLTLSNVKQAYQGNDKFLDLIDQYFGNGDVAAFDSIHNMYKLNYVYSKMSDK